MIPVIFKKEMKRVFSDRRLLLSLFIIPAVTIFIMYVFMGNLMNNMMNDVETNVPMVYIQNAPDELREIVSNYQDRFNIQFIEQDNETESIKEAIRLGDTELLVVLDDQFMERVSQFNEGEAAPEIRTYYNPSEDYSMTARSVMLSTVIQDFQTSLLEARFGDIGYVTAFEVDRDPMASIVQDDKKATGKGLGFIVPMMVTIMLFAGAMSTGMDSIAGEKERGTMATMLLTPVKRTDIALGKIISLGIISLLSAISSFIGMVAAIPFSYGMLSRGEEVSFSGLQYSVLEVVQLLIIMLVMTGLFVGIISLVSVIAKNVKEAGTYVSPIYILIILASYANMFSDTSAELYMYMIPVYNTTLAIKAILESALSLQQFFVTIGSSLVITGILVWLIAKAFNNEKIMLNA